MVLRQRLQRLARTNHIVEDPTKMRLQPPHAPLELAALPRGHHDHAEAQLAQPQEALARPFDGRRAVEAVRGVEFFDFLEGLFGRAPSWVLYVP